MAYGVGAGFLLAAIADDICHVVEGRRVGHAVFDPRQLDRRAHSAAEGISDDEPAVVDEVLRRVEVEALGLGEG